jgi:hypothetical protein
MIDSDFLAEYVHGRHTTDDYFERFVQDRLYGVALADCSAELRRRCSSALRSAFARLDALPRTDPVWVGSNNRPTFTKLREQSQLARIDEGDVESCWGSLVVALCSGDLERFGRASEALLRTRQLPLPDFLHASFNLREVSGWDTDELVAGILAGLDMTAPARTALDDLTKQSSPDRSSWATNVLRRLGAAAR